LTRGTVVKVEGSLSTAICCFYIFKLP